MENQHPPQRRDKTQGAHHSDCDKETLDSIQISKPSSRREATPALFASMLEPPASSADKILFGVESGWLAVQFCPGRVAGRTYIGESGVLFCRKHRTVATKR
jgi:hypothetical protein